MTPTPEALLLEAQVITARAVTVAHHCREMGLAPQDFYAQVAMELDMPVALSLLNDGSEGEVEELVRALAPVPS